MKKQIFTAFFALVISAPWACGLNYLNLETMQVESGSLVPAPTRTVKNATIDGEEGVMVTYDIKYVQIDSNQVSKGTSRIGIPGFGEMTLASGMKIPARLDPLFVGNGTEFEVKLVESTYKSVSFLPHFSPGIGTMSPQSNAISSNVFTPVDNATFFTTQRYRGNDICYVKVTPVSFNRVKLARIATRMSYFVKTVQGIEKAATRDFSDMPHVDFDMLNNFVINELTDTFQIADETAKLKNQSYLIISHSDFREAAETFAAWKKKLGYNMNVEIRNNWSQFSVLETIKHQYAMQLNLCYVLIIGNTQLIPTNVCKGNILGNEYTYESDWEYGHIDGDDDILPEFSTGRISVSTKDEANAVIAKIISYEQNPTTNADFWSSILGAAEFKVTEDTGGYNSLGIENLPYVTNLEAIRSYMLNQRTADMNKYNFGESFQRSYKQDRFYYASPSANPCYFFNENGQLPSELIRPKYDWDPKAESIISALNAGRFLTIFNGIGTREGWIKPSFNIQDVNKLTNSNFPTILINMNDEGISQISNNKFVNTLVNKPTGGAIAAINSISQSHPINYFMLMNMIDVIWPSPGIETPIYSVIKQPHIKSIANLGDVLQQGIMMLWNSWGYDYEAECRHFGNIYQITGDPSLRIHTGIPTTLPNISAVYEDGHIKVKAFPYHVIFSVIDKTYKYVTSRYEGANLDLTVTSPDKYEIWISGNGIIPQKLTLTNKSISNVPQEVQIQSITPNPAEAVTVVSFSDELADEALIYLSNINTGETIEFKVTCGSNSAEIDLTNVRAGQYLVSLCHEGKVLDSKQIIVK